MSRWPAYRARREYLRALEAVAGPFEVIGAESRDWASALFVGARHRLALRLDGPDAQARAEMLCDALPEMEIAMRGGFVADCQAVLTSLGERPVLGIEALTIEEAEGLAVGLTVSRGVRRAG